MEDEACCLLRPASGVVPRDLLKRRLKRHNRNLIAKSHLRTTHSDSNSTTSIQSHFKDHHHISYSIRRRADSSLVSLLISYANSSLEIPKRQVAIAPQIMATGVDPGHTATREAYEEVHVHEVYSQIAQHFSSTRYKPWPIVEKFLKELPSGSVGLDVGCGNGKYLAVNPNIFIVASDRSKELVEIATEHNPHSAIVADNLNLPHPNSYFDFAISIAVVHHLSSRDRRIQAISAILETLKLPHNHPEWIGGKALVYVWALEQKNSRRGWDTGDEQDVIVPWVMKASGEGKEPKTFHRYYHLYTENELEQDIATAGGRVLDSGYEKDNWWAIATRGLP